MKDLLAKLTQLNEDVRTPRERLAHDRLSQPDDKNGVGPGNSDEVVPSVGADGIGAGSGNSSSAVGESFPHDVDHMPGKILPPGTGLPKPCTNCSGHGHVYAGATKTPWINPSTKEKKFKRVPCPMCNKKAVTEDKASTPEMFRVDVLQGMRDRTKNALKKLGCSIENQGYTGGSTQWSFIVYNGKNQTVQQMRQALRDTMGSTSDDEGSGWSPHGEYTGWLNVEPFEYPEDMEESVGENNLSFTDSAAIDRFTGKAADGTSIYIKERNGSFEVWKKDAGFWGKPHLIQGNLSSFDSASSIVRHLLKANGNIDESNQPDWDDAIDNPDDIQNGDFVVDTSENEGHGEVFCMRGDMYDRRVRIEDKDGRGWYIHPSRLKKVTDEKRIAQWFPDSSDSEEYADESIEEAVNHLGEKEYNNYYAWRAACRKAAAPDSVWFDGDKDIANAMVGPNPYVRGETRSIGEWDGSVGSVYTPATTASEGISEALDANPHADWVNYFKSLGFVFDQPLQDLGIKHEMAWIARDPGGAKYTAVVKYFKSLGFEADSVYRSKNDKHANLDKGDSWVQVMFDKGNTTRINILDHLKSKPSPVKEATKDPYGQTRRFHINVGSGGHIDYPTKKDRIQWLKANGINFTAQESPYEGCMEVNVATDKDARKLHKLLGWDVKESITIPKSDYTGPHSPSEEATRRQREAGPKEFDSWKKKSCARCHSTGRVPSGGRMDDPANGKFDSIRCPECKPQVAKEDGIAQASLAEKAPKGWEGTVKAMKKHKEIDNPWALANYMKKKGYRSHKKESIGENRMPPGEQPVSQAAKEYYEKHQWVANSKVPQYWAHLNQRIKELNNVKDTPVTEKAPPGFPHEEMMKLKHKYGVPGAFKVAWTIHNKKDESVTERKVAHSEPYTGDHTEDGWWIVGKGNQPQSGPYSRGERMEMDRHGKYKWKYISGKNNEGKEMKNSNTITEGVKFQVSNPGLEKVLKRFPNETKEFMAGGELADVLYNALYDHYSADGEMPYGVMKARDGDPYEWIATRLGNELQTEPNGDSMHEGIRNEELDEIEDIFDKYPHEARLFKDQGDLDDGPMYDEFFDHFRNNGEMPYGVAKARDGDPVQWVARKLEEILSGGTLTGQDDHDYPADPEGADGSLESDPALALTDEGIGGDIMPQSAGSSMPSPLTTVEDTVDPQTDKPILIEGLEGLVTEILTEVGLDEGLDFFFDNGLVIIGRTTAKVAINALKADERITAVPAIESINGEEVHIAFNKQARPEVSPAEVKSLAQVPDLEESATDGIFVNGKEVDKDSITVSGVDTRDYPDFADAYIDYALFTDGTPLSAPELDELGSNEPDLVYELASGEAINRGAAHADAMRDRAYEGKDMNKKIDEEVSLTVNANGEEDVLNIIRKLSGMPVKEEPVAAMADIEEPEVEVEGEQYDNEPEPAVHTSTTDMINRGNDLNRPKQSYSSRPFRGDNPMAEAHKLMQKYEQMVTTIKK